MRKDKPLRERAVYESDNADASLLPPFDEYIFLVLESRGLVGATVLILHSGGPAYAASSVYEINPSYWLWTGAAEA